MIENAKPILFSTEMVKAILEGRKTQTRRTINPKYRSDESGYQVLIQNNTQCVETISHEGMGTGRYVNPRYQPGNILWVRETWRYWYDHTVLADCIQFKDGTMFKPQFGNDHKSCNEGFHFSSMCDEAYEHPEKIKWRPSIFMPRYASRITLRVTNVRCERLQDITEEDAIAEGMLCCDDWQSKEYTKACAEAKASNKRPPLGLSPRQSFMELWGKLNGKKCPWESNPYVWIYEFERIGK